ncbi:MAG: hypothetical protein K2N51_18870 [Lachnospiraceae bacterium]|nr:hypothetical protein [Lachnospiraceae bacterium]
MKLKYIEFVFENCDSIKIEGKYIGDFLVDDLEKSIKRIACNLIEKIEVANTIAIEIHKDANKERYQFNQTQYEDFKQMTFDRLKEYADITSIQFELEEDYVEEGQVLCREYYNYYVDWSGDSEYTNEAQKIYLSKDGNLYIVIADGKKLEDFFNLEEIDDGEYIDFHFDMCDVGDEYSNLDRYKDEENDNKEK